jgi:hypothetical protein
VIFADFRRLNVMIQILEVFTSVLSQKRPFSPLFAKKIKNQNIGPRCQDLA